MIEYYEHLCNCGCGGKIEIKRYHTRYGIPKYLQGHYTKGRAKSDQHKINISKSKKGCVAWNKGIPRPDLKGENNPAKRPEVRKKISESQWKGGGRLWWRKELLKIDDKCSLCKSKKNTEMHHKDHNENNNERNNLIIICRKCHVFWHKN